jgi:hypothetical protein
MDFKPIEFNLIIFIFLSLTVFNSTGCSMFGFRGEEQPAYNVLAKADNIEVREYSSYLVAKTTITGTYKRAQSEGFRILAGFIFGQNTSGKKMKMTSPVTQGTENKDKDSSEKIAMTAPVVIKPEKKDTNLKNQAWTMTFTMPSKYTMQSLPKPINSRVVIEEIPKRQVAVIRYTGFWSEKINKAKGNKLLEWIEAQDKYEVTSEAMFAGYNPPWTLPFLRRNEMWIEVKSK